MACWTLVILFLCHHHRRNRTMKGNVEEQVEELLRSIPIDRKKFNAVNQVKFNSSNLHSVRTGFAVKPNEIHGR